MSVEPLFAALNAGIVSAFAQPTTYYPSTGVSLVGTSLTINAILDDPRETDSAPDGTYKRLGANLADFPATPVAGDQFSLASGSRYLVQMVYIDAENWAEMLCRLKVRAAVNYVPPAPNNGGSSGGVVPPAPASIAYVPLWSKFTVPFTAIQTNGNVTTVPLLSRANKEKIVGVSLYVTSPFAAPGLISLNATIGDSAGTPNYYTGPFSVLAPNTHQDTNVMGSPFGASNVTITFAATGALLNALTAGSVDIDICTAQQP